MRYKSWLFEWTWVPDFSTLHINLGRYSFSVCACLKRSHIFSQIYYRWITTFYEVQKIIRVNQIFFFYDKTFFCPCFGLPKFLAFFGLPFLSCFRSYFKLSDFTLSVFSFSLVYLSWHFGLFYHLLLIYLNLSRCSMIGSFFFLFFSLLQTTTNQCLFFPSFSLLHVPCVYLLLLSSNVLFASLLNNIWCGKRNPVGARRGDQFTLIYRTVSSTCL